MNDMDELAGDRVKELRVSYIVTNPAYTSMVYHKGDSSWIGIYVKMRSLLTPEMVGTRLHYDLGISVPESVIEAILAYPRDNNVEKDVTVVFTY